MEAAPAFTIGQLLAADMLLNLNSVQLAVLLTLTDSLTGQRELIRALRTAAEEASTT
jgi:hypothetical protein